MAWKITFEIYGKSFSPKSLNIEFRFQNEPDDIEKIGRFKGEKIGYGSASFEVPKGISRERKFEFLADKFEPLLDEIKVAGAEDWHINIDRLYYAQCNEELSVDEIKHISRLKCSLTYTAYSVSEEKEIKGFD